MFNLALFIEDSHSGAVCSIRIVGYHRSWWSSGTLHTPRAPKKAAVNFSVDAATLLYPPFVRVFFSREFPSCSCTRAPVASTRGLSLLASKESNQRLSLSAQERYAATQESCPQTYSSVLSEQTSLVFDCLTRSRVLQLFVTKSTLLSSRKSTAERGSLPRQVQDESKSLC
jgi:hypothetical protein